MRISLFFSLLQSSTLGLLNQPVSAAPMQVSGHLFQPSQSYVPAVANAVPLQPSYVPASQPVQLQTYSSLPFTAQQQAAVIQPLPAQGTLSVPQSCPPTRQSGQPVVQAGATVPQSYTPAVQQLASTHILPPLQPAEPGQTLPSLQQATQNVLPDHQSATSTVQPITAYRAVPHASTVQSFPEAPALQLSMQASQHAPPRAAPTGQEDGPLTGQATTQKGFYAAGMIAVDSVILTAPLQTSHAIEVPVQPVS